MNSRIIRVICVIACLGLLALILGLVYVAYADGGYHAERYAGRFDPLRAATLTLIVPGCLLVAVFAWGTVADWRSRPKRASLASVVSAVGWLISGISSVAIVIAYPAAVGPWVVPTLLAAPLFLGVGLGLAGIVPEAVSGLRDAIRRRDRGLLVGIALVVAWLVVVGLARL